MTVGNRILQRKRRVDDELVKAFSELPVAVVSDSMSRVFAGGSTLRPMHRDGNLAGVALTVRTRPGDNLMLHKAIDMAEPGDVIVCDAGGDTTNALMGELMLAYAVKKGVAGFVLNGAIRDLDGFRETNLPTFAAGVTHRGPYKNGPGEVNTPISLGGMVIEPGDLILGDSDGLIAVPFDDAATVLEAAQAKHAAEENQMAAIHAGKNDRSWVDKALQATGCSMPRG
ncbi:RraA family protein [Halomonas sp. MCCC 1A17488]|uniref:RraA family protein n=1 Tax=unclassified Halomonas TaxID=2609666 RepID=UPI0018D20200|nr:MULTISPECIES: RraA family protein [unclassified Halomonas]MCE8016119.1 RraA family protein [Halomonas sp. MCCC 1A17488]MCG3239452.1 RraA family protein [Halomonas sp. MCCC 1A17488]QPP50622.1 RraA family protein [Halomonas sp. SS10-MC5]